MGLVSTESGETSDEHEQRPGGRHVEFSGALLDGNVRRISYRLNPRRRSGLLALASGLLAPAVAAAVGSTAPDPLGSLSVLYALFALTVALMLLGVAPMVAASRLEQTAFSKGVNGRATDEGLELEVGDSGNGEGHSEGEGDPGSITEWQVFSRAIVKPDVIGLVEGKSPMAVPFLRDWFDNDKQWELFVELVTGNVPSK